MLRTGFGIFSDIMPGSIADLIGTNPPYVKTFQGGLLGTVGGTAIAPGVPNSAVDATVAANQRFRCGISARAALVRLAARQRGNVPSTGRDYGGARRQASRAVLHGVEPRHLNISSERRPACKRNTSARAP